MIKYSADINPGGKILTYINGILIDDFLPTQLRKNRCMHDPYSFASDNVLIIGLRTPENVSEGNYYGVNEKGEIIWELNKDNYLNLKHSFETYYLDKEKQFWFINKAGGHYQIDHKTGEVLDSKYENVDYEIRSNILETEEKGLIFDKEIEQVLVYQGVIIVLLKSRRPDYNNVFGVSKDGKILWNIAEVNPRRPDSDRYAGCIVNDFAFRHISPILGKEEALFVAHDSFTYKIDHETGKILEMIFTK